VGNVKRLKRKDLKNTEKEAEKFYVPFRNGIFLSYALALAESIYIKERKNYDLFVGFKCEGKEHYPDTTPEFVKKINELSKISCTRPFKILAPLIKMDKEDIILLGERLGVALEDTWSCYVSAGKKQCGRCLACMLRKEGFYWANVKDKTKYS
jgi:7-cyano-7-deazaguanine synthase